MSSDRHLVHFASWCLSLALSLAALDVGLSLLSWAPPRFVDPAQLLAPLCASTLIFLAGAAIWVSVTQSVAARRRLGLNPEAAVGASTVFLAVILSMASLVRVLPPRRPRDVVPLGLVAVIAALAAAGSYRFLLWGQTSGRRPRLIAAFQLAVPLLLIQALALLWFSSYPAPRVASGQWVAGFALFVLLCSTTVWAALRFARSQIVPVCCGALLLLIVIGAIVSVGSPGVDSGDAPNPARDPALGHIFMITIDTLRADQLDGPDDRRPRTPNIDRLAERSLVFRDAVSEAPWTLPSFASILSGFPVAAHGVVDAESSVPDEIPILMEYLQGIGYRTAAVGHNSYLTPDFGLARGLSESLWYPQEGWGDSLGARAIQSLLPRRPWNITEPTSEELARFAGELAMRHATGPLFLWLHFMDPHLPYSPSRLPDSPVPPDFGEVTLPDLRRIRVGFWAPSVAEQARIKALYQAEVEDVDRSVGTFLETLRGLGIFDDALIVLTSDHGEEFFEHGGYEHGHSLYQELLQVPLMMKLPGQTEGRTVSTRVSIRALTPTLLKLVGVEPAESDMMLPSLLTATDRPAETLGEAKPLYLGGSLYYGPREGVVFGGSKYLRDTLSQREELYDLSRDPGEHHNLVDTEPELVQQGRDLMDRHRLEAEQFRSRLGIRSEKAQLSEEAVERLRALGYIQ